MRVSRAHARIQSRCVRVQRVQGDTATVATTSGPKNIAPSSVFALCARTRTETCSRLCVCVRVYYARLLCVPSTSAKQNDMLLNGSVCSLVRLLARSLSLSVSRRSECARPRANEAQTIDEPYTSRSVRSSPMCSAPRFLNKI